MGEKEPKVAPIIRLPQIRAERGAPSGLAAAGPPDLATDVLAKARADDEAGMEEPLEDEEEPELPLQTQISGDQTRLSGDTGAVRAGVSGLLRRALLNFAEQERQRARLVTILVVVQAAMLLVVAPGYLFGHFLLSGLLVVLGGLGVFGIVWLLNWTGRVTEASFLLVVGGGALVVLDLLLSAAHLLSLETLHIALLFLLVILSGGILFSPETAVILAIISALFTTIVLLVFHPSPSLAAVFTAQGRYLSLVYLALIQLGVGVVAWLFGRQMQESVHLITYVAGLQMSNKRLHKRLHETAAKKRNLETGIAIIQQTHARVAAGDYAARAHVEGDLLPLAVSLNLMLERVESFVHGEYERERMETAVAGLAELAGRVGQESLGQIPVPTGTALDGLSIAIKQMQTNVNQRLTRVQQSAVALMATVGRCQDHLLPVAEVLEEHLRSIDALVLAADNIMNSAQRQSEFATQAEQLLLAAAPVGIDLQATEDDANRLVQFSALRLAEEKERLAALASKTDAAPGALQASTLAQGEIAAEPAASLEAPVTEEQAPGSDEQRLAPAADTADMKEMTAAEEPPVAGTASGEALEGGAERAQAVAVAPQSEASLLTSPVLFASGPSERSEDASVADASLVLGAETAERLTLADVDREAAEEVWEQKPDWNLEQMRALAGMLAKLVGEATQQERNARTLTFKLRAMLQGMPNTRRVDMMAGWLRAALDAVTQSAVQVQQASKTIPASAFHSTSQGSAPSPLQE